MGGWDGWDVFLFLLSSLYPFVMRASKKGENLFFFRVGVWGVLGSFPFCNDSQSHSKSPGFARERSIGEIGIKSIYKNELEEFREDVFFSKRTHSLEQPALKQTLAQLPAGHDRIVMKNGLNG